jgi:hypothetical protein
MLAGPFGLHSATPLSLPWRLRADVGAGRVRIAARSRVLRVAQVLIVLAFACPGILVHPPRDKRWPGQGALFVAVGTLMGAGLAHAIGRAERSGLEGLAKRLARADEPAPREDVLELTRSVGVFLKRLDVFIYGVALPVAAGTLVQTLREARAHAGHPMDMVASGLVFTALYGAFVGLIAWMARRHR